jgi:hypothetical protein
MRGESASKGGGADGQRKVSLSLCRRIKAPLAEWQRQNTVSVELQPLCNPVPLCGSGVWGELEGLVCGQFITFATCCQIKRYTCRIWLDAFACRSGGRSIRKPPNFGCAPSHRGFGFSPSCCLYFPPATPPRLALDRKRFFLASACVGQPQDGLLSAVRGRIRASHKLWLLALPRFR